MCLGLGLLKIPEQVNWVAPMKHLSRKKHSPNFKIGCLHGSFLCALLLSSVLLLGKFMHLYWTITEKRNNQGVWGYGISRVTAEMDFLGAN